MSLVDALPNYLNLSPHLSAQKYFLVCTLTVAAWDTLVLTPRSIRLMKTNGWPTLKILFHFLRVFMPLEFIVVAVAFFDTNWNLEQCQQFFLFEPICTAILLAVTSAIHVIRIQGIYDKDRTVLMGMGSLFALQIIITAITCGFYRSVPLLQGQGCIAGPKANWVGIYWVAPTLLYTASFILAVARSVKSLQGRPMTPWKLMLRDGLNLYGSIWAVNMINMLFWFIANPTDASDPIKTIITSMTAVLTTSMSLRIILLVKGPLAQGGSFQGSVSTGSRTTHVISTGGRSINQSRSAGATSPPYPVEVKDERAWPGEDFKAADLGGNGIQINVEREVDDQFGRRKN